MSIFKESKDNVNENKKDDLFTVVDPKEQEVEVDEELLASILSDDSLTKAEDTKEEPESPKTSKKKNAQNEEDVKEDVSLEESKEESLKEAQGYESQKDDSAKNGLDKANADTDSVTVITKGTTINGSIISDCSLDVMGTINGDIECLGKLTISGKVTGNAMAAEVFVNTDRLEGNIVSEGCVKIGLGTVIVGDIVATSGVIAGAVKGEIDVKGPLVIDSTAIIKGNIKAKSVQMNNGAVLDGYCSLVYASVEIDNIFE